MADLKSRGDAERHRYEHSLAQNQDVQLDAEVDLTNDEESASDAIKEVEASLAQFGIKVPEGKHDMATVQSLLRQALVVESKMDGEAPETATAPKQAQEAEQPSKKAQTLLDISRKETVTELGQDITNLNKEIKVDEVTINLLQKRLEVAKQTMGDHRELLSNKEAIKEQKEAENVITIEDVSKMEKKDDALEKKVKDDKMLGNKLIAKEIRQSETVKRALGQAMAQQ